MQDFETIGSWQFQILPENKPVFLESNTTGLFQDISSQDAGDSSPFSAGTWRVPDTNQRSQQHDEPIPSQVK